VTSELQHLWSRVVSAMQGPLGSTTDIAEVIDQGLEHAAVVLESSPKSKTANDAEAQTPGHAALTDYMDRIRAL
jgi:hypothetical protein